MSESTAEKEFVAAPKQAPSEGAAKLRVITQKGNTKRIAEVIGCTEGALRHWVAGRYWPTDKWRQKLEEHYGIPRASWGEQPKSEVPKGQLRRPRSASLKGASSRELLEQVVERLRALEAEGEKPEAMASIRDRAAVFTALTSAIARLEKMRGEDALSREKIVASPVWRGFVHELAHTLEPWPEAAKAMEHVSQRWAAKPTNDAPVSAPLDMTKFSTEELQTLTALIRKGSPNAG